MKKTVWILLFALHFTLSAFSVAEADVPKYISFQGELTDSQGTRITTSKSVTFKLHSAASGGAILWSEVQTLTPANGIVSAAIGSATTGGVSLAFDTGYWLGVTVSPDAEMSPRIRLTTSPYAFIAKFLDTGAVAYGALSVAETVTANKFVGNGAGLTGVTASSSAPDTDWNMTGGTSGNLYRLSGNVGIGTASPSDSLHVAGTVRVSDSMTVGDTVFVVNSKSGNVGIGTTSPTQLLTLNAGDIRILSSGGVNREIAVSNGGLNLTTTLGDAITLKTNNTPRLTVATGASGNVGIGTTAPGDSLHVAGRIQMDTNAAASAADGAIRWSGSDFEGRKAGAWTSLTGVGAGGDITGVTAGSGFSGGAASGNATISLDTAYAHTWTGKQTFSAATTFSDSVIVSDTVLVVNKQSGNVGIGTTSPGSLLHIGAGTYDKIQMTDGSMNSYLGTNGTWTQWAYNRRPSDGVITNGANDAYYILMQNGSGITFNAGTSGSASERMRITSAGNVGIGSTSPGAKLDVVGSVLVSDSMVVGDTRLVVLKSGNVGLGTNAPSGLLDMQIGGTPIFKVGSGVVVGSPTGGDRGTGTVNASSLFAATSVGIGTTAPGAKLDVVGSVLVSDSMVVGDTRLVVLKSGNVGIGTGSPSDPLHVLGTMRVMQANAAGTFVITSSGLVGIGTTAPATKMHVYENGTDFPVRVDVDNPGNSVGAIVVRSTGTGALLDLRSGATLGGATVKYIVDAAGKVGIGTSSPSDSLHVAGPMRVMVNNATGTFVITNSGNVGIGTTAPGARLDVAGTAKFSDSVIVSDTALVVDKQLTRVGIGTASPAATLDVAGAAAFRGGAYTGATGNNNDISIPNASYVRLTGPGAAFTITGIAGGQDGRVLIPHNATTTNMTISNNDALSTAANEILTMTGAAVSTTGEGIVTLVYSATDSRWLVTSLQQ